MDHVLDSSLISRSLNYHGQQLKKAWESERGEGDLEKLNVENVDFAVFQERQKSLGFQDRAKRLKLHQFIAKNANLLFDEVLNAKNSPVKAPSSPSSGDLCAVLPPLDSFVPDMDKKERIEHFLSCLRPGDLVFGSLITKLSTGYLMKVFCSDGDSCKVVFDLGIKAIVHSVNMIPAVDKKNVSRSFLLNDLVCCEVLEVVVSSEKIYAGMKGEHCAPTYKSKLGLIHSDDLPVAFKKCQEGVSGSYDEMLTSNVGFQNPGNVKYLSEELGLGNQQYSNFSALRFGFPVEESAAELRQAQSAKWAFRSVADGIAHFKAGRHTEAFQCLNKALTIDAANIEALVARGALYANGGNFKKAIEDFEGALKTNGNHQNARKYLAETLVAYGRSFEDEGKFDEAISTYEKCLSINPYHEEAKNSIEYIKTKQGKMEPETIPLLTPGKTQGVRETLKHLLAQQEGGKSAKKKKKKDKKSKHKKNRSRSSSSSSSSSSSTSSSSSSSSSESSSASSQDSHHKKKHKRKGEHKDRSLSPISKKLALMDSQAAIEGIDGLTKLSHYNPPAANPYIMPVHSEAMSSADMLRNLAAAPKSSVENEYEMKVKKFLEQTRGDDDYEEKVRKFLEETVKWKKDRKGQEEKKKKKKKDKKLSKKERKKKKSKKLKKTDKEEKVKRSKRRRSASNNEEEEFGSKTDLSRLLLPDSSIPDLEDLQSKLSAYYARVDKAPKKRDTSEEKHQSFKSQSPQSKALYEAIEKERDPQSGPRKGKKSMDMFEESADSSSDKGFIRRLDESPSQTSQKIKQQQQHSGSSKSKKEKEHVLVETWDELEEKEASLKDDAPPPPPPTKDEMAQNLKKIVEKKKESAVDGTKPVQVGPSVMDKLGGFRINPANVPTTSALSKEDDPEHKRKSRTAESESESEGEKEKRESLSSRSRSPVARPKRKYSGSESSEGSYKGRSRSKSGSYSRRRYRSSDSGSYSRSYSRSRSRSRSYRSRSRSDDRRYGNRYPGRYPRNRGTYYRPRFQNNGNFKNRGYNRGGYRSRGYGNYRDYGNRDYRNRGFRGGRGRGRGPRYYNQNRRDYRDYRRYDRGSRSEDDDSPMRKVDAAKEKIDKIISQEHTGPLSEGEERDEDYGGKWNKDEGSSPIAEK